MIWLICSAFLTIVAFFGIRDHLNRGNNIALIELINTSILILLGPITFIIGLILLIYMIVYNFKDKIIFKGKKND